jgi:photosystem II stability/assembly factor-like uncharacterized protein
VGPISLQTAAKNSNNCIVADGTASQTIAANEIYKVTVPLHATAMPLCPGGAPVPITVNKTGGGGGNIVATPSSLSCDSTCTSKMAQLEPGTSVSLNVDLDTLTTGASWTSTFDGWSGACTGTTTCFIRVEQAASVTARFSCHGWCPENPTNETNNLNAVWGFSPTRVVAVGDSGTILQRDGTSWKRIPSNVTANLRSVHGVSSGTGYAVGAGGTILKTTDSGSMWTQQNSTTSRNLRGVFTFDGADTYAVGDNIMPGVTWLRGDGTTWSNINRSGVDYNWNALWGLSPPNFYVVGEMGRSIINNPYNVPTPVDSSALYGVYGASATTLIAVGFSKTILRLNGTSWTTMMPPAGTGFPVLRAIHGTAANQMYTVGDSGTVWSFDGTSWSIDSFPVQTQLNGVFVFSASELYVVGQGGLIYHKKP